MICGFQPRGQEVQIPLTTSCFLITGFLIIRLYEWAMVLIFLTRRTHQRILRHCRVEQIWFTDTLTYRNFLDTQ